MENVLENIAGIKGEIADFINANRSRVETLLTIVPFHSRLRSRLDLERYWTEHPEREDDPLELGLVETIFLEEALLEDLDRTAQAPDVINYAKLFCQFINSVYGQPGKEFFPRTIAFAPEVIDIEFYYGKPIPVQMKRFADGGDQPATGAPAYAKNVVWFRRPSAFRHWLRLQGISDADRVFSALIEAGY